MLVVWSDLFIVGVGVGAGAGVHVHVHVHVGLGLGIGIDLGVGVGVGVDFHVGGRAVGEASASDKSAASGAGLVAAAH